MMRLVLVLLLGAAAFVAPAAAQTEWPSRPIHLIVPFPPGSSSDIVARLVAQSLSERLHQAVVTDNRPGASGNIGTEAVARAAPDGYTLGLANTSTLSLSPSLSAKPAYNPLTDFAPITMIGASPFVLAANPVLPVKTVQELIALAKAKPGTLNFASAGPGTLANLAGVLFAKMANADLTPVYYRGSEQEVLDVIEGRVNMQFATIPPTLELIRQGKLRALAVTSARRNPALPDVPTIAESGLSGYEAVLWQVLYVPAGTPQSIVTRLNAETVAALHGDTLVGALAKLGVEATPSTPAELAGRIAADLKKWREVIVNAGIAPQ
jgi:tripartite-type tricarboxylate transporter receptor subunit TctC